VRLDSFAKFLAPGLRLGWVTAAAPLVQKLTFCIHGTTLGACATTQVTSRHLTELAYDEVSGFAADVLAFVAEFALHSGGSSHRWSGCRRKLTNSGWFFGDNFALPSSCVP